MTAATAVAGAVTVHSGVVTQPPLISVISGPTVVERNPAAVYQLTANWTTRAALDPNAAVLLAAYRLLAIPAAYAVCAPAGSWMRKFELPWASLLWLKYTSART